MIMRKPSAESLRMREKNRALPFRIMLAERPDTRFFLRHSDYRERRHLRKAREGCSLNTSRRSRVCTSTPMLLMKIKLPIVALAALLFAGIPLASSSSAAIGIAVSIAPPPIPIYQQPYCPGPGYLWTPGYWAYSDFGYYWVPGIWVLPPRIGFLWTPGYWGYNGGRYVLITATGAPPSATTEASITASVMSDTATTAVRWVGNNFRYNTAVDAGEHDRHSQYLRQ